MPASGTDSVTSESKLVSQGHGSVQHSHDRDVDPVPAERPPVWVIANGETVDEPSVIGRTLTLLRNSTEVSPVCVPPVLWLRDR